MRRRGLLGGAAAWVAAWAAAVALPRAHASAADADRWTVRHDDGIAWLVTPEGRRFYSLGVNVVDGGYAKRHRDGRLWYSWRAFAPSLDAWIARARRRLLAWGFNTAGGWAVAPQLLLLPEIIDLELGRNARFHWFDPFAPETAAAMMERARVLTAPYRGSPDRIGYFSDNEVGWWAGALFGFYSAKPAASFTKRRWVALVRAHYAGDWGRFTADFLPPAGATGWDALRAATAPTHLRPSGAGSAAVAAWAGVVAEHYYALCAKALRAADPHALYFGDRLPIYYDPAAVRAMAPHVDAIAVNYNVDAGDGWLARYFFAGLRELSGGKPVLISEWFFAARENRTGDGNHGHLMTVATQAERARGAAAATRSFAALPEIVGSHWFQYYDDPKGGRDDGEDYDFGLVDSNDRPYRRLTAALAAANRAAPAIHAQAKWPGATPPAGFVVPKAEVSIAARSLTDWPKPASLLPPLTPSRGAVVFGEIYLTWSARGLAAATIGQDYFDIDLFAYDGPFPLGDAYRLELGIDAGAGPRCATLFFIPPKTKLRDHPPMAALLCAGTAAAAIRDGCRALPGAEAVYFGADQPRITATLLIPWPTLGIAAPAPGATLRIEAAMTAWHRARWMSLSGRPPEAALADPGSWTPIRLGG